MLLSTSNNMDDKVPPDCMASSHSSGSRHSDSAESRPRFLIPGINGKARCLLARSPQHVSSVSKSTGDLEVLKSSKNSSVMQDDSNNGKESSKKKKKKLSSTSRRRKSKKRIHEAQSSRRSLDDTYIDIAMESNRRSDFLHLRSSSGNSSSPVLATQTTSEPLLDVQDIGYQSEEVMGTLIERRNSFSYSTPPSNHRHHPVAHNSLRFLHRRDSLPKKETDDDDYLSLTQNLHNSILRRYDAQPTRTPLLGSAIASATLSSSSLVSLSSASHLYGELSPKAFADEVALSPRGHKSMSSLLYNNNSSFHRDNSAASSPCSSQDPYDLVELTALSKDDAKHVELGGPMERLYTSMSNLLGHPDWSQQDDTELLEKLHHSVHGLTSRERQKLKKSTAELPPLPLLTIIGLVNSPKRTEENESEKINKSNKAKKSSSRRKREKKERPSITTRKRRSGSRTTSSNGDVVAGAGAEQESSSRSSHSHRLHHNRRGSNGTGGQESQTSSTDPAGERQRRKNSMSDSLQGSKGEISRTSEDRHHRRRKTTSSNSTGGHDNGTSAEVEDKTSSSERRKKAHGGGSDDHHRNHKARKHRSERRKRYTIPELAEEPRSHHRYKKHSSVSALDDLPADRPSRHEKKKSLSRSSSAVDAPVSGSTSTPHRHSKTRKPDL
jgi:hypothetical protein